MELGGAVDADGNAIPNSAGPGHAGGVTVDGDNVYVTDDGTVYTYSLKDLRNPLPGEPVQQAVPPQTIDGGAYSAIKDGKLYVGDFKASTMYVYEKNSSGQWEKSKPSTLRPSAKASSCATASTSSARPTAATTAAR